MENFHLAPQHLYLPTTNGQTLALYLNENSGRLLYRDKINTLIGIKHPGIELGRDQYGYRWIIHHHYKNTFPTIEREDAFSLGQTIFYDERAMFYNQYEIIKRSLAAWENSTVYHWLWNNCQHFTNEIVWNQSTSETIDKVTDTALWGGGLMALFGALSNSKNIVNAGLSVMATGAIGKALCK